MNTHRYDPRALLAVVALVAAAQACHRNQPAGAESTAGAPGMASADSTHEIRYQGDFHAPLGVQLWSFREQAKADPVAMLRMVRRMGLTHVETAGLYDMPAAQLADALRNAGLRATSMHVPYEDFKNHPDVVIANAKALGVKWVGVPWYPHDEKNGFTEADARRAIADFNQFGRTLKDAGLSFFYHNHGYEPVPYGDGTLLDLIIRETDPQLVHFEMDVLWTWLPNVDPVALIQKYPGRFRLMHIKDMKPGIPRGSLSGGIPDEQKSVIGQGQVDWSALMAAAEKDGFEHYYIEDESTDPVGNVPKSISYLEKLKYPAGASSSGVIRP
jgi:sugar phosphate isomerase/epimerase